MADYRWDSPELQELLQEVMDDEALPLEDLREHPLHVRIGAIFYEDDSAFDSATRKKIGGTPVRIRLTDNWVRSLTSGNGLMQGVNDNANGVEAVILVDTAILNSYPEHARKGHVFNVLSWLRLEKEEDDEGNLVAKTKDGRPVWKVKKPAPISAITTRHFGAIDAASAAVIAAGAEATTKQLTLDTLWKPEAPAEPEPEPESTGEPREVGEEEPEGEAA